MNGQHFKLKGKNVPVFYELSVLLDYSILFDNESSDVAQGLWECGTGAATITSRFRCVCGCHGDQCVGVSVVVLVTGV